MRNIMRKSFIFLGVFVILFGCIIRDNVFAYTPVELYDNVWRLVNTSTRQTTHRTVTNGAINMTNKLKQMKTPTLQLIQ